jgi:hypothetical protein
MGAIWWIIERRRQRATEGARGAAESREGEGHHGE